MEPFEILTDKDKRILLNYINDVGGGSLDYSPNNPISLQSFLSSWNEAKKDLLSIFGEKLLLRKHISYAEPITSIEAKIQEVCNAPENLMFRNDLHIAINRYLCDEVDFLSDFEYCFNRLWYKDFLAENELTIISRPIDIPTPQGNRIRFSHGAKPMRILGKLARAFGYEEEYEHFRIDISKCRNAVKLEGELCLSIHPMDYITMSDNSCGWRSCMAWNDNPGECRFGTLEMLGSAYCVVAYLNDEKPYSFGYYGDHQWTNKKWRQLIFVHPAFIVGNRHYHFKAPEVEKIAMDWLKELAEAANFSHYNETTVELKNYAANTLSNGETFYLILETQEMYNDLNTNNYYIATNFYDYLHKSMVNTDYQFKVNLSGEARCITCGNIIDEVVDQSVLQCAWCVEGFTCSCCNEFTAGEPYYTNSDGEEFCSYCVENELGECDICEELYYDGSMEEIEINAPDGVQLTSIYVCPRCLRTKAYEPHFGEICEHSFAGNYITREGRSLLRWRYKDFDDELLAEHLGEEEEEND